MNDFHNKNLVWSKQKWVLSIAFILLLLLFPLSYLYYRINNVNLVPSQQKGQSALQDIAALESLVKSNPSFDNYINLSMAYINSNMPGKSIDYLKSAIAINSKSAVAYNNLGVAYIMLEQFQNGIDACSKALELDPEFQLAKNNLSWGTDEKNKILSAIKLQENASPKNRNIDFYLDYGLNYFKLGDYGKSIELWSLVFELDPKNTKALNNIGTAFVLKYQYDDAIVLFKKAIELEPDNQLAKNNLVWATDEKGKMATPK